MKVFFFLEGGTPAAPKNFSASGYAPPQFCLKHDSSEPPHSNCFLRQRLIDGWWNFFLADFHPCCLRLSEEFAWVWDW